LVMFWMERLRSESNLSSAGWPAEGEHLKRWRTFGTLKDDRKSIKASWELITPSLSTALARSSRRLSHSRSIIIIILTQGEKKKEMVHQKK